jgi:hypothetical protein
MFPMAQEGIGRGLGHSLTSGLALCYFILTETGKVISRSTVKLINSADKKWDKDVDELDKKILAKLGGSNDEILSENEQNKQAIATIKTIGDAKDPLKLNHHILFETHGSTSTEIKPGLTPSDFYDHDHESGGDKNMTLQRTLYEIQANPPP